MAQNNYVETEFQSGEKINSSKLNSFNSRIKKSNDIISAVFASLFNNNTVIDSVTKSFDKLYYYDQSGDSYTDWTEEAEKEQTPYFPDVSVSTVDYVYAGYEDTFDGFEFTLASPGASDIGLDVEYYNGSSWVSVVSPSDATSGLTSNGKYTWATSSMTSWDKDDLNTILSLSTLESTDRYWIRYKSTNGIDYGIEKLVQDKPISDELKVKPTSPISMYILLEPGYAIVNNKLITIDSEIQILLTTPIANKKITTIQLSDSGKITIKDGTSAVTPKAPTLDDNNIKLADIEIDASDTTIGSSAITDMRIFTSLLPSNISENTTTTISSGTKYIYDLEDSDSYFVIRDPDDSIETLWVSQDGYGTLYDCNTAVSVGNAVYYDIISSQLEKADASVSSLAAEGIVVSKPTNDTAVIADRDVSKAHSGLTPGEYYYLSETAGALVTSTPTTSNSIVQKIGRALSATDLKIDIDVTPVVIP